MLLDSIAQQCVSEDENMSRILNLTLGKPIEPKDSMKQDENESRLTLNLYLGKTMKSKVSMEQDDIDVITQTSFFTLESIKGEYNDYLRCTVRKLMTRPNAENIFLH